MAFKKYLLFCYGQYYPGGGMHDFVSSHTTIEAAKNRSKKQKTDYYQVVNKDNLKVESTNDPITLK